MSERFIFSSESVGEGYPDEAPAPRTSDPVSTARSRVPDLLAHSASTLRFIPLGDDALLAPGAVLPPFEVPTEELSYLELRRKSGQCSAAHALFEYQAQARRATEFWETVAFAAFGLSALLALASLLFVG